MTENKIRISNWQLFLLTLAQMGGASILYLPGMLEAGRNVWISNMIASLVGYIVIYLHYKPQAISKEGGSLSQLLNKSWGRFIGGIANFYYVLFFFVLASLIISDVYYFGKITMPETPPFVFVIFLLAPAIYAVKLGIETIARFLEFLLPVLIVVYVGLLLLAIPKLEFRNLLPIMADGVKPVFAGALPNMNFPYAQVLPVVFLWQYTDTKANDNKAFIKTTFSAVLLATILLTFRAVTSVAAFQEETLKTLAFPPFSTIRLIEVGDVLERLDALFLGAFYVTTFYKLVITYYVICTIVKECCNLKEVKGIALPVAVFMGFSMPFLVPRFDIILQLVVPYFFTFIPLLFILPILLYITIKLKGSKDNSNNQSV